MSTTQTGHFFTFLAYNWMLLMFMPSSGRWKRPLSADRSRENKYPSELLCVFNIVIVAMSAKLSLSQLDTSVKTTVNGLFMARIGPMYEIHWHYNQAYTLANVNYTSSHCSVTTIVAPISVNLSKLVARYDFAVTYIILCRPRPNNYCNPCLSYILLWPWRSYAYMYTSCECVKK